MNSMIIIKENVSLVTDKLSGQIKTQIPLVGKKEAKNIAELFAKNLNAGAPFWHGDLKDSIRVVDTKEGFGVEMSRHGSLLDTMRPHFVPTGIGSREQPSPPFKEWVQSKGITSPFVLVKPKKWITPAINVASEALRTYVKSDKNELAKFVKQLAQGPALKMPG